MRNLKRALSLALASVMVLGLMIVGSSAMRTDFPDAADVDEQYGEAIDVLSEIGYLEGDEQGNLKPDEILTRAMAAKFLTIMRIGVEGGKKLGTYVKTFDDVESGSWAAGYIGYCKEFNIIAGDGLNHFMPNDQLTAVQFGKMLLVALGYDPKIEGYEGDSWKINVAADMTSVNIDLDDEDLTYDTPLTREQAAQMILNTIEAPMVEPASKTEVSVNGAQIVVGGNEVKYKTTTIAKEQTISRQLLSNTGPSVGNTPVYTVEFGEEYIPGLVKTLDQIDDFGRPSHKWSYNNNDIDSYVDDDKYVTYFTDEVTGGEIWNAIGSVAADYPLKYYVDGKLQSNAASITATLARKNNTPLVEDDAAATAATGDGVLTEIYVDNADDGELTIVVINTYLAQATSDYNESKEYATLGVYRQSDTPLGYTVNSDTVPEVVDVVDDDYYLVNISFMNGTADGEVVKLEPAETLIDSTVTKFTDSTNGVVTKLTSDGIEYKANHKAFYKTSVLQYNGNLLTDTTYNIYLDKYNNFIGVNIYEGTKHYVFITGYDRGASHIAVKNATANAIFLDGKMENITVNATDTSANINSTIGYTRWDDPTVVKNGGNYTDNRWYSYTVDSKGVYTLKPASMTATYYESPATIKTANVSIKGGGSLNSVENTKIPGNNVHVYGEDESIYITVKQGKVDKEESGSGAAITGIDDVYTGVQNVTIDVNERTKNIASKPSVYTVYDSDDYHIIGAIVLGVAQGSAKDIAYILSTKAGSESYIVADDTYEWTFEAVVNGEIVTLTAKTKYPSAATNNILGDPDKIVKLRYDSDNKVVGYDDVASTDIYNYTKAIAANSPITTEDVYFLDNLIPSAHNNLYAKGRTFNFINTSTVNDNGLSLVKDCKAVVIQPENGKTGVRTQFQSVETAIAHLANGGADYDGDVIAVLNNDGAAEWMVFVSNTALTTSSSTNNNKDATIDHVNLDNSTANVGRVQIYLKGNVSVNTNYNFTIYKMSEYNQQWTIATTGTITVSSGTASKGLDVTLQPGIYKVEINGHTSATVSITN